MGEISLLVALQNSAISVWVRGLPLGAAALAALNFAGCAALILLTMTGPPRATNARAALPVALALTLVSGAALLVSEPFRFARWDLILFEMAVLTFAAIGGRPRRNVAASNQRLPG